MTIKTYQKDREVALERRRNQTSLVMDVHYFHHRLLRYHMHQVHHCYFHQYLPLVLLMNVELMKVCLLHIEVTTDEFPEQTSWRLEELSNVINSSDGTVVMEKNNFERKNSVYVRKKCLESLLCYQFTIYDSKEDGICCDHGRGNYKVRYDNKLVKRGSGGSFGRMKKSELFGDGCVSLPSSSPSLHPSSTTNIPSTSPSSTSTTSSIEPFHPSPPPSKVQDFDANDDLNRRMYPSPLLIHHEDVAPKHNVASYQTWPNCSATALNQSVVGCVSIPKKYSPIVNSPPWAGSLYSGRPPICQGGKCDMQIPMSNNALQVDAAGAYPGKFLQATVEIELLSDDKEYTTTLVLAAADNEDGFPDIIVGNNSISINSLVTQTKAVSLPITGVR